MLKTDKPLYEVVNQRTAGYLMSEGFPLIELIHKERCNSFMFVESEALHEAMRKHSEYTKRKRERTNTRYYFNDRSREYGTDRNQSDNNKDS